ncbi:MAG: ABC transporter substrate-binding protein [Candidatus Saliniplasma sp.]
MENKYKKILTIFLALAMVSTAVVFSGCVEDEGEEQTLVVGTTDRATTLDPADSYDYFSSNILFNTVEQLIAYEPGTSEVTEGLAEDWEIEDEVTYRFHLREGVTFHDGTEMTSSDVEFSLERARDLGGDPGFLLENIDDVEPVDDYEFIIHLERPESTFLTKLGYTVGAIVSEEAYVEDDFSATEVVGTGPYELESWDQGEQIRLKAFDDYWGDQPYAKEVVVQLFEDSSQLHNAMDAGEIDVGYREFTPQQRNDLEEDESIQTKEVGSPYIRYIVNQVQEGEAADERVRQAFAYALDREAIDESIYEGTVEPLHSMVPNDMWGHKPSFEEEYGGGQNLEEARALLEDAGYSEEEPLEMDLHYTPSHYGPLEDKLAQKVQEQFEDTDMIEVSLESAEWTRYTEDMVNGDMGVFLLGWYPDYFDPDGYISPFLTPSGGRSLGSFYNNTEMTEMIEAQQAIVDEDERTEILADIQDLLAEEAPYIPLYQGTSFAAYGEDVDGDSVILGPLQIFRYYTIKKEGWER